MRAVERRYRPTLFCTLALVCLQVGLLAGCSSDKSPASTRPSNTSDRQESALKDPFGYSPNIEKQDVSGGDLGNLDRNAMKKDIDHVLNP